jgi:hypothetical protein
VNVIFWRCWSDKLVFEVKRTGTDRPDLLVQKK